MVLIPTNSLFIPPLDPPAVGTTPLQSALARNTASALRNTFRASPLPFVMRRVVPAIAAIEIGLAALDYWNQWMQETADLPQAAPPLGELVPGTGFWFAIRVRVKSESSGEVIFSDIGGSGGSIDRSVGVTAPIAAFLTVVPNGTNTGDALLISDANGVRTLTLGGVGLPRFDGFVSFVSEPFPTAPAQPQFAPFAPPATLPSTMPPAIIPITPTLPVIPGVNPFPRQIPLYVPLPFRLPSAPVPVLPGTPEEPERDPLAPPMWIVPGGIETGTPSAPIVISIPAGIPDIVPELAQEYERERVPPRVGQCLDTPRPPDDDCDCEEIREIVIEELDNKFPPKRPTTRSTISTGCEQSGIIDLPRFTQRVRIQICERVINTRTQNGVNAPDVVYAGWYSFGGGAGGDRHPISYEDMTVYPPPLASSISYTMYTGNTARVTIEYLEETN